MNLVGTFFFFFGSFTRHFHASSVAIFDILFISYFNLSIQNKNLIIEE
jgi:hypothetical protein